MSPELIISMSAVAVAVFGLLLQYFAVLSKIKERLTALETKVGLFWKGIEGQVVEMLKSPTNLRKDELLDLLREERLTLDGARELKEIIEAELKRKAVDGGTALACAFLFGRLDQIIFEHGRRKR